jgi:2-polyprenyl-6-methoxyphenol hydroxylase-like FAD-dependent oxidoreductase
VRALIVGAGVAGLTLAGKLLQQGRTPVVVERADEFLDAGYSLGIYPLGSSVLHGLGKYDELLERGEAAETYRVVNAHGELLQDVDLASFTNEIGPMVLISRTDLIEILHSAASAADIRMGTTVSKLDTSDDRVVRAELSDGSTEEFDLVVVCDGMGSPTREMAFDSEPDVFDTDWVLWAWWAAMPDWDRGTIEESWGRGQFFGLYPTAGRIMCCAGFHKDHLPVDPAEPEAGKAFMRERFQPFIESDARIGEAIDCADRLFLWPMADVRAPEWSKGRILLLGDAAVGFMPTAGAGANTAMRTAGSLADELSRVNGEIVPLALEMYEKRCREIVEDNQKDSRTLARYVFVDNRAVVWGRDKAMKHYPMQRVVGDIIDAMHTPF